MHLILRSEQLKEPIPNFQLSETAQSGFNDQA
jgi:hypothetical protein